MSGITMDGRLYTLVRGEALDSLDSVIFLRHLLPQVSAKLLVIWDGSPIHKGDVRTFLAEGGAKQIHVEQLPAYAPDLNPAEGVWHQLKNVKCGICAAGTSRTFGVNSVLRFAACAASHT